MAGSCHAWLVVSSLDRGDTPLPTHTVHMCQVLVMHGWVCCRVLLFAALRHRTHFTYLAVDRGSSVLENITVSIPACFSHLNTNCEYVMPPCGCLAVYMWMVCQQVATSLLLLAFPSVVVPAEAPYTSSKPPAFSRPYLLHVFLRHVQIPLWFSLFSFPLQLNLNVSHDRIISALIL